MASDIEARETNEGQIKRECEGSDRKLLWVPNLRWFLPHHFAMSLRRLSEARFEPAFTRHYLQPAVALHTASGDDIRYYLEPRAVLFCESSDADDFDQESPPEEYLREEPVAGLVGYHSIGTLNGIVVWRTHQIRSASIPDERIALSQEAVAGPTTIILLCGWSFVAMAVLLFWISLTATELGAASQREHGYGAVFALALGAPTLILTLLYRASWRRYWRQVLGRDIYTAE